MGLGWLPPATPTLCYAHDLDFERAAAAANSGVEGTAARQRRRLKVVELRALSAYAGVAAISPLEAHRLRALLPPSVRVAALPAGTDVESFSAVPPPEGGSHRVLFVGALGSGPDADAADWLGRDIWPTDGHGVPTWLMRRVDALASAPSRETSAPL